MKNYVQMNFREDLKIAMWNAAGGESHPTTLLINDNQITNEIFLEDVNNVFNSGEVPNLWENEEKDEISKELQEEADRLGVEDKYKFFV